MNDRKKKRDEVLEMEEKGENKKEINWLYYNVNINWQNRSVVNYTLAY